MSKLNNILSQKLNPSHFLLVLILTCGITVGLFVLSLIFGWLCCMEPAAGPRMYSNLTLFGLLTTDILILLLILFGLYRNAKKKARLDFQKNYLIQEIIVTGCCYEVSQTKL